MTASTDSTHQHLRAHEAVVARDYESARNGPRVIAFIIDVLCSGLMGQVMIYVFKHVEIPMPELLVNILMMFLYWALPTANYGQTLGKHLMGLKVIDFASGNDISLGSALIRETVGRFISGIVLAIGYLWAFIDDDSRAWHDHMAKTRLVQIK